MSCPTGIPQSPGDLRIIPTHRPNPEIARTIEEWAWDGLDWDGLHPGQCQLYETKYGYDDFLQDDWGEGGRPFPADDPPWAPSTMAGMMRTINARVDSVDKVKSEVDLLVALSSVQTAIYVRSIVHERRGKYWVMIQQIDAAADNNAD